MLKTSNLILIFCLTVSQFVTSAPVSGSASIIAKRQQSSDSSDSSSNKYSSSSYVPDEDGEGGYYVEEYAPPGQVTNVQQTNDDGSIENTNPPGSSDPYGEPASTAGGSGGGLDYDESTNPYTSDGSDSASDSGDSDSA